MGLMESVFNDYRHLFVDGVVMFFKCITLLVIGWWIINKVCKVFLIFFQKFVSDSGIISFLDSLIKFSLRIVLVVMALGNLGLNINSLLAAIGASLVAVGISLKDSISNLVSGIILVVAKPIHVGDYIEFENSKGTVIKIEMLFTTVQTQDENKIVIIPNSRLITNNITRQSEYDVSQINMIYKSDSFTHKYIEFNKYFEKEFILNQKISQMPKPSIDVRITEDEKILVTLNFWTQNKYIEIIKNDMKKSLEKLEEKYKINLKVAGTIPEES